MSRIINGEIDVYYKRVPGNAFPNDAKYNKRFEGKNSDQLAKICAQDSNCRGFTDDGSLYWEDGNPNKTDSSGYKSYVKQFDKPDGDSIQTINPIFYWEKLNTEIKNEDLDNKSYGYEEADFLKACSLNPECEAVNNWGYLKGQRDETVQSDSVNLYEYKYYDDNIPEPEHEQDFYGRPVQARPLKFPNEITDEWPPHGWEGNTFSWILMPLIFAAADMWNIGSQNNPHWIKFPRHLKAMWSGHLPQWLDQVKQLRRELINNYGSLQNAQNAIQGMLDGDNHIPAQEQERLVPQTQANLIWGIGTKLKTKTQVGLYRNNQVGSGQRRARKMSGYNLFVKQYSKKYSGNNLFKKASQEWNKLSQTKRNKYTEKASLNSF